MKAEVSGFLFEGTLLCPNSASFDHNCSMCMRPFKKCLGGPYRYQLVPCNSGLVALDTLHKCHSARPVIVVVHPWTRAAVTVALLLREVKA